MSDISQITLPSGSTYNIKDSYARGRIDDIVAAGLSYEVVDTLPTASASTKGKIYLVAHSHGTSDIYDEFLTVQGGTASEPTYSWEKIGNTDIDLSDYVTGVTLNKKTATALVTVATAKKHIKATASGASTAWNSKDAKTAVTGYGSPTSDSVIGADATFSYTEPNITLTANTTNATKRVTYVESVSTTGTNKLETTSIKGVSGTVGVSKMTAATSQTTAKGSWTASNINNSLLANISVSGEVLSIGAATLDTQTTTQWTESAKTVATANSSNTTVATGSITSAGTGSTVVTSVIPTTKYMSASASNGSVDWGSKDEVTALTGLGTPSTASVIGASSTFTITQPTVTISASDTSGDVEVVTGVTAGSTTTALTSATTITVTKS
jgi:hypothetical protein